MQLLLNRLTPHYRVLYIYIYLYRSVYEEDVWRNGERVRKREISDKSDKARLTDLCEMSHLWTRTEDRKRNEKKSQFIVIVYFPIITLEPVALTDHWSNYHSRSGSGDGRIHIGKQFSESPMQHMHTYKVN